VDRTASLFLGTELIHAFVGNWGWSIILLTVLIKLVSSAFPLQLSLHGQYAPRCSEAAGSARQQCDDRSEMSQGMNWSCTRKEKNQSTGWLFPILVQDAGIYRAVLDLVESVENRTGAVGLGWITDLSR